jgi:hypothetical protein
MKFFSAFKSEKNLGIIPPIEKDKLEEYNQIMSDFQFVEKEVWRNGGQKEPYSILFDLAKSRAESNGFSYSGKPIFKEQAIQPGILGKPDGRQALPILSTEYNNQSEQQSGINKSSPVKRKSGILRRFRR